ncbi:uncharacterized protein I206_103201 [Kwoniella pini CBS 10737]|uniref:Bifunctional lycopene cyclase/phytoene synthase n=1 Tax=Kwoniella pini CBS 10737 TaxID=1296096 RepID=A0A1B9IAR6_9TREE|nr:uncharacterized protein I206_01794 [Kwoniella pini CBS 10737]OCF52504.1 hypothetical protein I206_01794 [Kwoniella pini CBS 10737]
MSYTYMQIHLYFIIPPIILLWLIYRPLIGRREIIKFLWLGFMATIWTTPWDNFILSQDGWTYPTGSIIGKIGYIPIEEHLFFILQPILIILLHLIITHKRLLPFDVDLKLHNGSYVERKKPDVKDGKTNLQGIQTLRRRPLPSLLWSGLSLLGLRLVLQTHLYTPTDYGMKQTMFYLGWILVWINPVIAFLTFLGAKFTRSDWVTVFVGTGHLWIVDTIALRSGSWSISPTTTLGVEVWRGLPIEEAIFFFLTTYLIVLSSSLISHIHTLLVLSPSLPPCPSLNPLAHIQLLAKVAFNPPRIDKHILAGLKDAERTLKKGSKSFEIAKLAFGREMRLGLVVIYAWCRVTDDLIDDPFENTSEHSSESLDIARSNILDSIRKHLIQTYEISNLYPASEYPNQLVKLDKILDEIPNLKLSDRSAFHLFSLIIPRLIPIYPFLELCNGFSTDLKFPSKPIKNLYEKEAINISDKLPIKTTEDLLIYADDVAGSIASSICYLSWSILDSSNLINPIENYNFSKNLHNYDKSISTILKEEEEERKNKDQEKIIKRIKIIKCAREMGISLQLINISRDIIKDGLISRLYIPLSYFNSTNSIISILFNNNNSKENENENQNQIEQNYNEFIEKLLNLADNLKNNSINSIELLPNTSKSGIKTMIISYYEIAISIKKNKGKINERGIKVGKWNRIRKSIKAFWI